MPGLMNRPSLFRTWAACAGACLGFTAAALAVSSYAPLQATALHQGAEFVLRPGSLLWFRLGLAFSSAGLGNWLDPAMIVTSSAVAWSLPVFVVLAGIRLLSRRTRSDAHAIR
jgi:hypothetical protein